MMKKILIISPTPTHPQNAGNRSRIFNVADLLRKSGYDVHFLMTSFDFPDSPDLEAMSAYWKDALHLFKPEMYIQPVSGLNNLAKKAIKVTNMLKRKFRRLYYRLHYSGDAFKYNYFIDDYYNPYLQNYVKDLQRIYQFNIVLIEYVHLSKAFLAFDHNVLKLLDTHDILSNRYKIYLEKGLKPEWLSFFSEEESIGFNRADIVIAIQEEEKNVIRRLTNKEVVMLGHTVQILPEICNRSFNNRLVFVASHNSINMNSINDFIDRILPKIQKSCPDLRLILAGSIIRVKDKIRKAAGVEFLGEVADISIAYESADIVINPLRFGTGLKIKSIEALSFGKPMVSFKAGMAGLNYKAADQFCMVCETEDEFIQSLLTLINDESLRNRLKENALKFIESYNQQATAEFFKSVETKLLSA
jgi:glycosyltransferase involved in cell wall biosynthesis